MNHYRLYDNNLVFVKECFSENYKEAQEYLKPKLNDKIFIVKEDNHEIPVGGKQLISDYCNMEVEGWERLPEEFVIVTLGDQRYNCSFIHNDGIQFLATMEENLIYVSIAPMYTLTDVTKEELDKHLSKEAFNIIQEFFGDRFFYELPEDKKAPDVKHYHSLLP